MRIKAILTKSSLYDKIVNLPDKQKEGLYMENTLKLFWRVLGIFAFSTAMHSCAIIFTDYLLSENLLFLTSAGCISIGGLWLIIASCEKGPDAPGSAIFLLLALAMYQYSKMQESSSYGISLPEYQIGWVPFMTVGIVLFFRSFQKRSVLTQALLFR